jgi:hypothetical protein
VWLSSILDHFGVISTGGVLVALLQIFKARFGDRYPQYFSWSFSRRLFLLFVVFAVFQAWQQEYKSRIGREKDLVAANHSIDLLRQDHKYEAQRITAQCESKNAVNETLQHQNRDQQQTINGCLTQAMKLLTPEPQKATPIWFDRHGDGTLTQNRWIVLINKTITPVDLFIACNKDLESVGVSVIGVGTMIGGGGRLSRTQWEYRFTSPAWGPTSPIFVTISSHPDQTGDNAASCSFTPR